jgi:hypothetical protein
VRSQIQDVPHGGVLEIERHSGVVQPAPPPERGLRTRLAELFLSFRHVGLSLISAFSWVLLATLTGVVWALSVSRFLLATGWAVVFYFAYAAASGGFTVVCALLALDISMKWRLTTVRTVRE